MNCPKCNHGLVFHEHVPNVHMYRCHVAGCACLLTRQEALASTIQTGAITASKLQAGAITATVWSPPASVFFTSGSTYSTLRSMMEDEKKVQIRAGAEPPQPVDEALTKAMHSRKRNARWGDRDE